MANYGNLNVKRNKKGKKVITVVICTVAAVIVCVSAIGFFVGGEETENVSNAVKENTQLKIQIGELNDEIEKMQAKIDELQAMLDARPTLAPTPYASANEASPVPSATAIPQGTVSPRTGIR